MQNILVPIRCIKVKFMTFLSFNVYNFEFDVNKNLHLYLKNSKTIDAIVFESK